MRVSENIRETMTQKQPIHDLFPVVAHVHTCPGSLWDHEELTCGDNETYERVDCINAFRQFSAGSGAAMQKRGKTRR